jgi:glucose/arabinose dehydrogenase
MRFIVKLTLLCCLSVTLAAAQPSVELERAFPSLRFSSPVGLESARDGTNRIFIVEQSGVIKVIENNDEITSARTFLDFRDSVTSGGEMGLLGLAFHPQYETNGHFYVQYTRQTDSLRSYISRFSVHSNDPDSADPTSQKILLRVNQPYTNHNGGGLAFGPDGYLYIGLGDGGSGGDPLNNAQNRSLLLGKILRIDVNSQSGELAYGIPADNPFAGNLSGWREEIFAYGLRNPWRFSFDPVTGILWCGDVGQSAREEIDLIEKGMNYGWRIMEGMLCYNPPGGCDTTGLTMPIWDYGRSVGGSVTGGYVYRGQKLPDLVGLYVYGDFVSGRIWALEYGGPGSVANIALDTTDAYTVSSFGIDEEGELFCCSLGGEIFQFKLRSPPTAVEQETSTQPSFRLFQNYPNPFNSSTSISYELPSGGRVNLTIFDPLGRTIDTLVDEEQPSGRHAYHWTTLATTGLYYCRLTLLSPRGFLSRAIPLMLVK